MPLGLMLAIVGGYVKLFTKIVVHIYWSLLKNIKVKNMEILCKKILTTLLIYSKIAMFECWLLSLAPILADCVGCIFLSDIGSVQQVNTIFLPAL